MVTSCLHFQHQTLESSNFLCSVEMFAHSLAAGAVNLGIDSMVMIFYSVTDVTASLGGR